MWCIGEMTGEYLARMEDVLALYQLPYDDKRPVICLDELPFQMLGEKVAPIEIKPGGYKEVRLPIRSMRDSGGLCRFRAINGQKSGQRLSAPNESRLLSVCSGSCRWVGGSRDDYSGSGQLEHAPRLVVLREPAPRASLLFDEAVRVSLHAQKRLVAQYGGVGTLGSGAAMLGTADSRHRNIEQRTESDCERAKQVGK